VPIAVARLGHQFLYQFTLLHLGCERYDGGGQAACEMFAMDLAIRLRVVFSDPWETDCDCWLYRMGVQPPVPYSQRRSVSLTRQFGLKDYLLMYDAGVYPLTSDDPYSALTLLSEDGHRPGLDGLVARRGLWNRRFKWFEDWWHQVVIRDTTGHTFTREELVLNMADTEGGAHVDSLGSIEQESPGFYNLAYECSLYGGTDRLADSPVPAAIRHIAYEALVSLALDGQWFLPDGLRRPYLGRARSSSRVGDLYGSDPFHIADIDHF
jgi:hypothetical protein